MRPRIGVMGPSECSLRARELAREVGVLIARRGGILVCGGGRGVMEAAAAGAKEAGGITLGILPGSSASEANPYIDIPIVTGLGNARNVINVLTSHAIIVVHGAYGTLSEIALALKCGTPVVALETWTVIPPAGEAPPVIIQAPTPEEAVSAAFASAKIISPRR
ncbi:MAG: TIGR00725 family protein [Acidobacteriia bacterium]|nr:TIGR00725 family protein [Terriglobia bacterium]